MRAFVTGSTGIRRGTLAWTQVLHAGSLAKSPSHSKCPSGSECPRVGVDLALNRGKTVLLTKTKVPSRFAALNLANSGIRVGLIVGCCAP